MLNLEDWLNHIDLLISDKSGLDANAILYDIEPDTTIEKTVNKYLRKYIQEAVAEASEESVAHLFVEGFFNLAFNPDEYDNTPRFFSFDELLERAYGYYYEDILYDIDGIAPLLLRKVAIEYLVNFCNLKEIESNQGLAIENEFSNSCLEYTPNQIYTRVCSILLLPTAESSASTTITFQVADVQFITTKGNTIVYITDTTGNHYKTKFKEMWILVQQNDTITAHISQTSSKIPTIFDCSKT
jgi:hypothetical protein